MQFVDLDSVINLPADEMKNVFGGQDLLEYALLLPESAPDVTVCASANIPIPTELGQPGNPVLSPTGNPCEP